MYICILTTSIVFSRNTLSNLTVKKNDGPLVILIVLVRRIRNLSVQSIGMLHSPADPISDSKILRSAEADVLVSLMCTWGRYII